MNILSYIKSHKFVATCFAVIVIILVIFASRAAHKAAPETQSSGVKKVELVNAATFRKGYHGVSADGIVESRGQADLKSQTSAPIAVIHGAIGDPVYVGQVILELENADTRAQLAQARANLALAKGQYLTSGVSLSSAQKALINKIRDSYTTADDAIRTDIDPILYNNAGSGSTLASYSTDSTVYNRVFLARTDLITIFREWNTRTSALTVDSPTTDINAAVDYSQMNLDKIDRMLGDILQLLNDASRSATESSITVLSSWKTIVSGARNAVNGADSALTAADSAFLSATASQGSTGQAQISVAEAGVKNLEAQLAKTIIRSPINGKIAALPLRVGELASPGALVATVIGEGGLQIRAYASGDDLERLRQGASTTIQGHGKGVVTSIAPSVNSGNKKVEVLISVVGQDTSGLVVGENVSVNIASDKTPVTSTTAGQPIVYSVPIQNILIIPGSAYVYTIDADSKIKKNEIMLGQVQGDFIEVTSGLNDDMNIVSPVYELQEGQEVQAN